MATQTGSRANYRPISEIMIHADTGYRRNYNGKSRVLWELEKKCRTVIAIMQWRPTTELAIGRWLPKPEKMLVFSRTTTNAVEIPTTNSAYSTAESSVKVSASDCDNDRQQEISAKDNSKISAKTTAVPFKWCVLGAISSHNLEPVLYEYRVNRDGEPPLIYWMLQAL